MLDFLTKMFRREESSKSLAKERLRLVLMSDRVALAPDTFDAMKGEMLSVLQRYLDIDEHGIDVHFENAERRFMLYANIPVTSIKSSEQIEQERQRLAVGGNGNGVRDTIGTGARRRRRRRRNRSAATNSDATVRPADSFAQTDNGITDAHNEPEDSNGAF
ncbi:MAG TPA: cell division topological specificity factor MinE [Candidatus Eremiobacteraceae bacterium]|nr:cell division topological specificity factor MinE [Candidatus Eremiobacteraceae bacterium]